MTDNIFKDISDDEWLNPTIQDTPLEIFEFGTYRLACRKSVSFSKGGILTVPEIQIDGLDFTRNGLKEGGGIAYFLEVTGYKEDDESYKYVDILFTAATIKLTAEQIETMPDFYISEPQQKKLKESKEAYFSLWNNFYMPDFGRFDVKLRNQIGMGQPFHAMPQIINYDKRPKLDQDTGESVLDRNGKPAHWYDSYRTNWKFFDSVDQMKQAKKDHWADSNGATESVAPSFVYPDKWGKSIQSMTDYLLDALGQPDADLKVLAEEMHLTSKYTPDYKKILVATWQLLPEEDRVHLAKELDMPLPMIDLP